MPKLVVLVSTLVLFTLILTACRVSEETPGATPPAPTTTRPAASPTAIRPTEVIVNNLSELAEPLPTIPLPGQKVLETEHFAHYVEDGYLPVSLTRFAETAEEIYEEISAYMGAQAPERFVLSFQLPDDRPCPARGMIFFADPGPRITIFADEQTDESQILGVLAHEVAHGIHGTGFDRPLNGDPGLTEGLATWITRDYWTTWHQTESLDGMVRSYLATGDYVRLEEADVFSVHPLVSDEGVTNCLAQRDAFYSQWAAFVGYLINTYGWNAFMDLMASAVPEVSDEGAILPKPTDYQGVYGKTLPDLEADWLTQLQAGP